MLSVITYATVRISKKYSVVSPLQVISFHLHIQTSKSVQPLLRSRPETGHRRPDTGSPVVIACGIANPQRFVHDVKAAGWQVARVVAFPASQSLLFQPSQS